MMHVKARDKDKGCILMLILMTYLVSSLAVVQVEVVETDSISNKEDNNSIKQSYLICLKTLMSSRLI